MKKSKPDPKSKVNSPRRKRRRTTTKWSRETLDDVARSFADPKKLLRVAEARSLNPAETKKLVNVELPATLYPNHSMDGRQTNNPTIRIHPSGFITEINPKYRRRRGSLPGVDFTPGTNWKKHLNKRGAKVYVTEGIKKSAAASTFGYAAIAIDGCDAHQSRNRHIALLPELEELCRYGPDLVLVVDSDYKDKSGVREGWNWLATKFTARGCRVWLVILTADGDDKVGWDDFLTSHGKDAFDQLPRIEFDPPMALDVIRRKFKNDTAHNKNEQIAEFVLGALARHGKFLRTHSLECYYFDKSEHHLFDISDCKDALFRAYLHRKFGLNGTEVEYKFVHEHLRSAAINWGEDARLAASAKYVPETSTLYLNAGNSKVIRVTEKGYEIEHNGVDGVIFRNLDMTPIEPASAKRGSKTSLRRIIRMPNFGGSAHLSCSEEQMLYELWMYSTFFPDYASTRTHLLLSGEKGSFKTSSLRALLHLLFGQDWDVNVLDPKRHDAAVALFTNLPIIALDNLDGKIPWLDDLLATAATGGRIPLRVLFETNKLVQIPLRPFICATSRDPQNFARDDVADRTLVLHVSRGAAFLGESELQTRVAESRPKAWRAILDVLPRMLTALRRHKSMPGSYRMADFANFAIATGPVLGHSVRAITAALDNADRVKNELVRDHSAVHQALEFWTEGLNPKVGEWISFNVLYRDLNQAWSGNDFPFRRPQTLGLAIANEKQELAYSFQIEIRSASGNKKEYRISPIRERDLRDKLR